MSVLTPARNGEVAQIRTQIVNGWYTDRQLSDANWVLMRLGQQASIYSDQKKAQVMRGILRLCRREHIPLRHGTVKHTRDLIRNLERSSV